MPDSRKIVKVFLASPGDLENERRTAKKVVDEFNSLWADDTGYQVELVGWEDTVSKYLTPIEGDPEADEPIGIGPFGGGLSCKIEPGDSKSFYFPFSSEIFLREPITRIGVLDTYNRKIWCRRRDLREVQKKFDEAFKPIKNLPDGKSKKGTAPKHP